MIEQSYLRDKEKYKIIVDDHEDRWELFSMLGCMSGTYRHMLIEGAKREYIEAWLTEDEIIILKLRSSVNFEHYRI